MNPLLSVIITAYNEGDYLREAVRSVQRQTLSNLEIILVDDGSTGRTREVVESLNGEPRLQIIRQKNQGPSAARNAGLKLARGKYVGFLDGDDLWAPDKAASQVAIMEEDPQVDLTFAWWRVVDEQGKDTGRRGKPNKQEIQLEDLIRRNLLGSTSNVIARKEALFQAGLFDPSLRAAEDMEFWIRVARLREGNLGGIPRVLLDYRLRSGQLSKNWQKMLEDWERVLAKIRTLEPQRVAAVEYEARAISNRYISYLAYEAEDYPTARTFLYRALRMKPGFLLDRGSWFTIAGVMCTLLPEAIHRPLARSVTGLRMKMANKNSWKV